MVRDPLWEEAPRVALRKMGMLWLRGFADEDYPTDEWAREVLAALSAEPKLRMNISFCSLTFLLLAAMDSAMESISISRKTKENFAVRRYFNWAWSMRLLVAMLRGRFLLRLCTTSSI